MKFQQQNSIMLFASMISRIETTINVITYYKCEQHSALIRFQGWNRNKIALYVQYFITVTILIFYCFFAAELNSGCKKEKQNEKQNSCALNKRIGEIFAKIIWTMPDYPNEYMSIRCVWDSSQRNYIHTLYWFKNEGKNIVRHPNCV